MSPVQYPATIHTHEGAGLIFEGHDLASDEMLRAVQHSMEPQVVSVVTEEVWLHFQPRVKNCANYGGPCDLEGEWHGHWEGVKPSPSAAFTIAYPDKPVQREDGSIGWHILHHSLDGREARE